MTGIKTKKEFLNSPQGQEQYAEYVFNTDYKPIVAKLKKQYNFLEDDLLTALVHFQGEGGAKIYLSTFKSKLNEAKGDVTVAHGAAQHVLNQFIKKHNKGVLPKNSTVFDYLTKFAKYLDN